MIDIIGYNVMDNRGFVVGDYEKEYQFYNDLEKDIRSQSVTAVHMEDGYIIKSWDKISWEEEEDVKKYIINKYGHIMDLEEMEEEEADRILLVDEGVLAVLPYEDLPINIFMLESGPYGAGSISLAFDPFTQVYFSYYDQY